MPEFRAPVLTDPDVHRHATKVVVTMDRNPDQNALDPQTITVRLTSGASHSITLPHVYGHPAVPLTAAENLAKFHRCLSYAARPLPTAAALADAVTRLEEIDDIVTLVPLMVAS